MTQNKKFSNPKHLCSWNQNVPAHILILLAVIQISTHCHQVTVAFWNLYATSCGHRWFITTEIQ